VSILKTKRIAGYEQRFLLGEDIMKLSCKNYQSRESGRENKYRLRTFLTLMLVLAFGLAFTPVLYGEDFIGGGDDGGSGLDGTGSDDTGSNVGDSGGSGLAGTGGGGTGGGTTGDGTTGDGTTDDGTTGDGTTGDGTTGDGTTGDGTTGDGTTGDGTTGDGTTGDGTTGDGTTGDGTTGGGTTGDGTTGDGTTGDGTTGDGTTGDGTTGDGCIGDESTGEDAGGDCTGGLDPEQEEDLTEQDDSPLLMTFGAAIGDLGALLTPLNNELNSEYEDYLDDLAEKFLAWHESISDNLSLSGDSFEEFIDQMTSDPVLAQKYADFLAMIAKNGITIEPPSYLEGELIDDLSLIWFYWFYHFGNYNFRDYVDFDLEQGEFLGAFTLFAMASSVGPPTYCENGVYESGECVEKHGPPTKCENGVHESGECVEKHGPPTKCENGGDYDNIDGNCRETPSCDLDNEHLGGNSAAGGVFDGSYNCRPTDDKPCGPLGVASDPFGLLCNGFPVCSNGHPGPYYNPPVSGYQTCSTVFDPPECEADQEERNGECVTVLDTPPECENGQDRSGECVTVLGQATCDPGYELNANGECEEPCVGPDCEESCTAPNTWDNGQCKTPQQMCVAPNTWDNGQCKAPQQMCTAPNTWDNGQCKTPQQMCTAPNTWNGQTCVSNSGSGGTGGGDPGTGGGEPGTGGVGNIGDGNNPMGNDNFGDDQFNKAMNDYLMRSLDPETIKQGLSQFAEAVYKDLKKDVLLSAFGYSGEWGDFVVKEISGDNPYGFYAAVFQKGNDVIIAYRGTEFSSVKDWYYGNFLAYVTGTSPQNKLAEEFALKIVNDPNYLGSNIYTTGHSLGGNLAQIGAGAIAGNPHIKSFATYNGLGIISPFLATTGIVSSTISSYLPFETPILTQQKNNLVKMYNIGSTLSQVEGYRHCNTADPVCGLAKSYGELKWDDTGHRFYQPITAHGIGLFNKARPSK